LIKGEKMDDSKKKNVKPTGFKPGEVNPLFKKFYRYTGVIIARKLAKTSITPNQVTYFYLITLALSGYLFFRADHASIIIAAFLLQFSFLLDYVDGSLSRLKNMSHSYGGWLDEIVGAYGFYVFVPLGIVLGLYFQLREPILLLLGMLIPISFLFKDFTQQVYSKKFEFAEEFGHEKYRKLGFLMFFRPTLPFVNLLITLGAIFNKLYWVVLFLGAYSPLCVILQNILFTLKARREFLKDMRKKSKEK